ncbi:hypothetical protein ACFTXB_28305 [Streptomyces sp. NPDC057074]|uniref:hypothetical protein n=1 Tax=Streptomyces sp. NPDC057074 TaxID=3346015 RepID=UPI003632561C
MELLTVVLPVSATVFVAIVGYLQWRRSERRQGENETVRQELEQAERRRIAREPFDQQRQEALQELLDKLRELEIQSRWNAGGQDLRAEVRTGWNLFRSLASPLQELSVSSHAFLA